MQVNPHGIDQLLHTLTNMKAAAEASEGKAILSTAKSSVKMSPMDSELIDAKVAASEARTDTKFAEMLGELKLIHARLDHMPTLWTLIGTVGAGVVAAISIILAVLSFTGDRMDAASGQGAALARIEAHLDRGPPPTVNGPPTPRR